MRGFRMTHDLETMMVFFLPRDEYSVTLLASITIITVHHLLYAFVVPPPEHGLLRAQRTNTVLLIPTFSLP